MTIAHHTAIARDLASFGLFVFPVAPNKKPLAEFKWREAATNVVDQWDGSAVAIELEKSGLFVVDCDRHRPGQNGILAFDSLAREAGDDLSNAVVVKTPRDGRHVYYRQRPGQPLPLASTRVGIDFKGAGGYVVAPGCVVQLGPYSSMPAVRIASAPYVPDWLYYPLKASLDRQPTIPPIPGDVGEVAQLLRAIPDDYIGYLDHQSWIKIIMAIHDALGDEGLPLAHQFSQRSSHYNSNGLDYYWRKFKGASSTGRRTTIAYLRLIAAKPYLLLPRTLVFTQDRTSDPKTPILDEIVRLWPTTNRALMAEYSVEVLFKTLTRLRKRAAGEP